MTTGTRTPPKQPNNKSIVGGKENNDRSSSSSSSNRNNHGTMHDAFLDMLKALEDRYLELKSKPLRIRVERWVSKLAYHVENPTWVKERNAYAAALLDAVTRNTFRDPFHALPPEGGLPAPSGRVVTSNSESTLLQLSFRNTPNRSRPWSGGPPKLFEYGTGVSEKQLHGELIEEQRRRLAALAQELMCEALVPRKGASTSAGRACGRWRRLPN